MKKDARKLRRFIKENLVVFHTATSFVGKLFIRRTEIGDFPEKRLIFQTRSIVLQEKKRIVTVEVLWVWNTEGHPFEVWDMRDTETEKALHYTFTFEFTFFSIADKSGNVWKS